MVQDSGEVLSHGSPASPSGRFAYVKAIFPFSGGLVLGGVLGFLMLAVAPGVSAPVGIEERFIPSSIAIAVAYALVVLLLLGRFSSRIQGQRTPTVSGTVGLVISILGTTMVVLGATPVAQLLPEWMEESLDCTIPVLTALIILSAPFLLVRWRERSPS